MKTTIDMAREAGFTLARDEWVFMDMLKAFEALVRADERNLWPAEMEAMERQVNILTDALAAEREACAKVCESSEEYPQYFQTTSLSAAIRNRGNT
jgi:hypothetical protein